MIDFTQGSPMSAILRFSLPMLIGNIFQQFYNMVDLIVVGRFVGVGALAAVGAASSSMFFLLSLCIGLTNGAAVVVAQYLGARDTERVQRSIGTALYLLGGAGLLLSVVGFLAAEPLLRLLGTPEAILAGSVNYLQIICAGMLATVVYNGLASILRAFGDSRTPLFFLIVAVVLNIGLDLLFVIVFEMAEAGVALATILAQAIAAVACLAHCVRSVPLMRLERRHFAVDRTLMVQTVKMGLPSGLQNSVISIANMAVQSVVNSFGATIVAAYSAAIKLDQLAVQPMLTLGLTTANYTAQNVGAGEYQRVRKGFRSVVLMLLILCGGMALVFNLFGRGLLSLFVEAGEVAVLDAGYGYLRLVSLFYLFMGLVMSLHNLLRGAGDVVLPTISSVIETPARYLVALLLSARIGVTGIWLAAPAGWILNLLIALPRYLSGAWQRKSLVRRRPDEMEDANDAQDTQNQPDTCKQEGEAHEHLA